MSNDTVIENLKYAKIAIENLKHNGYNVCLEIPVYSVPIQLYKDFGLKILGSPYESSCDFIRIVRPTEFKKDHIGLCFDDQTEEFDLTDEDFKEKVNNFLSSQ